MASDMDWFQYYYSLDDDKATKLEVNAGARKNVPLQPFGAGTVPGSWDSQDSGVPMSEGVQERAQSRESNLIDPDHSKRVESEEHLTRLEEEEPAKKPYVVDYGRDGSKRILAPSSSPQYEPKSSGVLAEVEEANQPKTPSETNKQSKRVVKGNTDRKGRKTEPESRGLPRRSPRLISDPEGIDLQKKRKREEDDAAVGRKNLKIDSEKERHVTPATKKNKSAAGNEKTMPHRKVGKKINKPPARQESRSNGQDSSAEEGIQAQPQLRGGQRKHHTRNITAKQKQKFLPEKNSKIRAEKQAEHRTGSQEKENDLHEQNLKGLERRQKRETDRELSNARKRTWYRKSGTKRQEQAHSEEEEEVE